MGQKVNPHGIRVGIIKDWDSKWFASKKDFGDSLVEDYKIINGAMSTKFCNIKMANMIKKPEEQKECVL